MISSYNNNQIRLKFVCFQKQNNASAIHQLVALPGEELIEESMFVLANVHHERASRPDQCTVVTFVRTRQVFDGRLYLDTHNLQCK